MSMELVTTTSSPTMTTDPSTSQYNETFGPASNDFEKLMGQDHRPTNFESPKAVLEVLDKSIQQFESQRLNTWLESYVDLLFTVSATLWETTQTPPSPEKMICNAIVVLVETAMKVEVSYKSLVNFFDRLQYYLQRVYDYYDFTESSNTAGIKLLLLKVMAEGLRTVVDYIKAIRAKPIKKVLQVLTRKEDISRILMPRRMDELTNEELLLSVSRRASESHDSSSAATSATAIGEKPIRDTNDNLRSQEDGYHADDSALAPQIEKSKDLAPPEDDNRSGSKTGSKVSQDLPPEKLQQWLKPPDPLIDHEAAHPGTGKWFIQGDALRWWKKKGKGASLLICDHPGSGKTTLCSSIIEEVIHTRNKSEIIARYYFDSEKPDKGNLRGLLASLVTQLCEHSKRLQMLLSALHTKCRNGLDPPTEAELTQLLNHLLAKLRTQSTIYIIIDGVDHCMETESPESPRKKVLKFLEGLVRSRHPNLNICITSSLKEGMEKSLKLLVAGVSSRLVILHDQDGQKEDIKTYIAAFVQSHMQTLPDKDKDYVIKTLSERAGGMFGWISHRLNALLENIPSQTSDILEEVGSPRDEEFARALHNIPEEKYLYATRLFQCLVAAVRPLSLKELTDISAELDSNADPHEDAVLSACPALIAHQRDKDDITIVQFSHKSVKNFLTSSRLRTSSIENVSRYHFSLKAADATLARVCINVLLRFDETADKTRLKESSPLALYAAQYWVQHTRRGNAATENQGVMERLFDPSNSHLDAWIWMHDVDKGQSRTMEDLADRPSRRSGTPLYYAALCGFTELVKHLAGLRPEDLHDSHGYYGTPLHAASYMGHYDAVVALLDSDPMMVDKKVDNKTPLHAAYYGGHLKIVKLLLDKGAEVDNTVLDDPYRGNDGIRSTEPPPFGDDSHSAISGSSSSLDIVERSPHWTMLHDLSSFDSRIRARGSSSSLDTIRPPANHDDSEYPNSLSLMSNGGGGSTSSMTSPSDSSSLSESITSHLRQRSLYSFLSRSDPPRSLENDDQHQLQPLGFKS